MTRPGALVLALALLGAAPAAAAAEPWLGDRARPERVERPQAPGERACSLTEPVCVHRGDAAPARAAAALAEAERAWGGLRALGMPLPLGDGDRGGSSALDLYFAEVSGAAAYADAPLWSEVDRAAAFVLLPEEGGGCELGSEVARAIAQAALFGLDAAVHEGVLALHSSYLASLIAPCHALELEAIDRFQRQPEAPLVAAPRERMHGALLLSAFLDERYGDGGPPGAVMTRVIAASTQRTPADAERWNNEPDVFDTLRRILPARGQALGDLLAGFAAARAFVGSRSDGKHLADAARFGDLGRVRFQWSIEVGDKARRLAPARPLAATGSSYLWLDLAKHKPKRLVLDAAWEESFVLEWVAVRVDDAGREIGRVAAGGVFGRDRARLTLESLESTRGVVVVVTSAGNDDRSHPYDPEAGPARESAWELTLRSSH